MTKITDLNDKKQLDVLRQRMNEVLADLSAELGLETIHAGGITYSDTSCIVKVECKLPQNDPRVKARMEMEARLLGLPPNIVGQEISLSGKAYTVTGFDMKRRKNPVKIQDILTSKEYIITPEQAKFGLKL